MNRFSPLTSLLAIAVALPAPAGAAGLSGEASMRVEIEVYKGPIGQSLEAQVGDLSAQLAQLVRVANMWNAEARTLARSLEKGGCQKKSPTNSDCAILYQGLAASAEVANGLCRMNGLPARVHYGVLTEKFEERYHRGVKRPDALATEGSQMPDKAAKDKAAAMVSEAIDHEYDRLAVDQAVFSYDGEMGLTNGCDERLLKVWANDAPTAKMPHATLLKSARLGDTRLGAQPDNGLIIRGYQDLVRRVAVVSSTMQIEAQRLAATNLANVPRDKRVRSKMAELGMIFGEYSQRISARINGLSKLLPRCEDNSKNSEIECLAAATKLPTGDYLRDSSTSRYLDVFRWFNASLSSAGTGVYRRDNRIAGIEQLTEDQNWALVNEVYASGQGDVGMAFIKNELGNWDLKSFSNDPTELLAAYRKAADAAIASAVKLATKTGGSPATAIAGSKRLLSLADQLSGGGKQDADIVDGTSLSRLRTRTIARLEALKGRISKAKSELGDASKGKIGTATTEQATAATAQTTAATALAGAETVLADVRQRLSTCEGACSVALIAEFQEKAASVGRAKADLAATDGALQTAKASVARLKAELDALGATAAEAAEIILQDHERDLAAIQEVTQPNPVMDMTVPGI